MGAKVVKKPQNRKQSISFIWQFDYFTLILQPIKRLL